MKRRKILPTSFVGQISGRDIIAIVLQLIHATRTA